MTNITPPGKKNKCNYQIPKTVSRKIAEFCSLVTKHVLLSDLF